MIYSAYGAKKGILDLIGVWGKIFRDRASKPHPTDIFTEVDFQKSKIRIFNILLNILSYSRL